MKRQSQAKKMAERPSISCTPSKVVHATTTRRMWTYFTLDKDGGRIEIIGSWDRCLLEFYWRDGSIYVATGDSVMLSNASTEKLDLFDGRGDKTAFEAGAMITCVLVGVVLRGLA